MRRLNVVAGATLALAAAWVLPPALSSIRGLCPLRPTGVPEAGAVAQFARRTGMACTQCHTAFPRLTSFGEKFKYNGFQVPGNQDGDDVDTQKINDHLVLIKDVGNWFGARVAFTPFYVKKAGLTQHNGSGSAAKVTKTDLGQANWLQFFTAGPVYKNVSIFIETEFAGATLKNNWMYLGWHNIAGREGLFNLRTGAIPALDWHAVSGRLRANPAINDQILSGIKSSAGFGAAGASEDTVGIESANPGVEAFGYYGPLLYSVVAQQGKGPGATSDPNQDKNYAGTLGYKLTDGIFEGSQVSVFGYRGVDTATTATGQIRNNFYRLSPGVTVRAGDFDFHGAYMYAEDKNWTLSAGSARDKVVVRGFTGKAGYTITPQWWANLQYDVVESVDATRLIIAGVAGGGTASTAANQNFHKVSPSIWFFPRENLRVGLTARADLQTTKNKTIHGYKEHELFMTIRAMF